MNDNCVSYRTLKLQIPESPMRPHFVKARVRVHVYPDGSSIPTARTPSSTGQDASDATTRTEGSQRPGAPLKSARRRASVEMWTRPALPTVPQHNRTTRSGHLMGCQNRTTSFAIDTNFCAPSAGWRWPPDRQIGASRAR
jgi:hypothetical protein